MTRLRGWLTAGVLAVSVVVPLRVWAEEASKPAAAPENAAATQPADAPRSEDVMRDLGAKVEPNPMIEPVNPTTMPSESSPPAPDIRPAYNPAVLGTAPGQPKPKMRREGEFVVNRKGRLIHPGGGQSLFLFDADSENAAEAPLPLLPCQMLQNMEDMVRERGDSVTFIISGQITLYRNTNFLMPTMMKLAVDRGNLQR
ncbi:MAG: hypothetical protein K8S99_08775 [Planctomycetes bacterium]|nr:hypothetical protein [Planctomycetota bacterium]